VAACPGSGFVIWRVLGSIGNVRALSQRSARNPARAPFTLPVGSTAQSGMLMLVFAQRSPQ